MRGGRICGHNKIRIEAHNPSEPLELGRQRPSRRSCCRYRRLLVAASLCLASHMLTRATSRKHVSFPTLFSLFLLSSSSLRQLLSF